jgi:hypothetical protein
MGSSFEARRAGHTPKTGSTAPVDAPGTARARASQFPAHER